MCVVDFLAAFNQLVDAAKTTPDFVFLTEIFVEFNGVAGESFGECDCLLRIVGDKITALGEEEEGCFVYGPKMRNLEVGGDF